MSWWLVSFARGGPARYISHLDTMRVVQRTFARAGIELALSQGMRPKPRLSLPLPLPTGAAALDELAVVEVAEARRRRRCWAPACGRCAQRAADGLTIERLGRDRRASAATAAATRPPTSAGWRRRARPSTRRSPRFAAEPEVSVVRASPKGRRAIELKEYVCELSASPCDAGTRLAFTLRYGPAARRASTRSSPRWPPAWGSSRSCSISRACT